MDTAIRKSAEKTKKNKEGTKEQTKISSSSKAFSKSTLVKSQGFFHTTYSKKLQPIPVVKDEAPWIIPFLFLIFLICGMVFSIFNREFRLLLSSIFRRGGLGKLFLEENHLLKRTQNILFGTYLFSFSLFLFQTLKFYQATGFGWNIPLYPGLLVCVLILTGFKLLMIKFLGNLFSCKKEAIYYHTGIVLTCIYAGLLIIPISLGIKLASPSIAAFLINTGLVSVSIFYLLGLLIGINTGMKSSTISKFHLILYLCALEILPVIVLIKAGLNFL